MSQKSPEFETKKLDRGVNREDLSGGGGVEVF